MTISLTGAFVIGFSLHFGSVLAFEIINLGPKVGAQVLFAELLGSAILLIVFFREFDEDIAA
jgi:hypothetical protein